MDMENNDLMEEMLPDVTLTRREKLSNWFKNKKEEIAARREARKYLELDEVFDNDEEFEIEPTTEDNTIESDIESEPITNDELVFDDENKITTKKDVIKSSIIATAHVIGLGTIFGAGLVSTILLAPSAPLLAVATAAIGCAGAWVGEDATKMAVQEYRETKNSYEQNGLEPEKKVRFAKIKSLFSKNKERKNNKPEKKHRIRNFLSKLVSKKDEEDYEEFYNAPEIPYERFMESETEIERIKPVERIEPVEEVVSNIPAFKKLKQEQRKVVRIEEFKIPNSGLSVSQYLIDTEDEFTRKIFESGIENLTEGKLVSTKEEVVKSKTKTIYTFIR